MEFVENFPWHTVTNYEIGRSKTIFFTPMELARRMPVYEMLIRKVDNNRIRREFSMAYSYPIMR